ncbi:MAG: HpcH/HpaI aldolase family protein [Eubacteriales bacterium]|jgi:2-keto-3-deoxy-L-rhamnonate aldolase RhmA
MHENKLRNILAEGRPSVATRIWSTWPTIIEAAASSGSFDYLEFVAEYSPYSLADFENMARAAELHGLSTMIKVDFQNRFYVAQKALACGFQSILFTDHKTPDEVRETLHAVSADCPEDGGRFGCPTARWIGYYSIQNQMEYAAMVRRSVKAFMIEKKEAMDNIEEICSIPGVDMVQFGPFDYCLSQGWNIADHREEVKEAEQKMIEVALRHGVQPRCECDTMEQVEYYKSLGVKHFCVGDEMRAMMGYWNGTCAQVRKLADSMV